MSFFLQSYMITYYLFKNDFCYICKIILSISLEVEMYPILFSTQILVKCYRLKLFLTIIPKWIFKWTCFWNIREKRSWNSEHVVCINEVSLAFSVQSFSLFVNNTINSPSRCISNGESCKGSLSVMVVVFNELPTGT